jgi:hypothetical protein
MEQQPNQEPHPPTKFKSTFKYNKLKVLQLYVYGPTISVVLQLYIWTHYIVLPITLEILAF